MSNMSQTLLIFANIYINLRFQSSHFKLSTLITISKPNKVAYDSSKYFWLIVLLNTLGKLINKIISERLQVQFISSNFIYFNQLGELKQCSTTDAELYLTYLIHTEWVKSLYTSNLTFDIIQFFSLLDHLLFLMILDKIQEFLISFPTT